MILKASVYDSLRRWEEELYILDGILGTAKSCSCLPSRSGRGGYIDGIFDNGSYGGGF